MDPSQKTFSYILTLYLWIKASAEWLRVNVWWWSSDGLLPLHHLLSLNSSSCGFMSVSKALCNLVYWYFNRTLESLVIVAAKWQLHRYVLTIVRHCSCGKQFDMMWSSSYFDRLSLIERNKGQEEKQHVYCLTTDGIIYTWKKESFKVLEHLDRWGQRICPFQMLVSLSEKDMEVEVRIPLHSSLSSSSCLEQVSFQRSFWLWGLTSEPSRSTVLRHFSPHSAHLLFFRSVHPCPSALSSNPPDDREGNKEKKEEIERSRGLSEGTESPMWVWVTFTHLLSVIETLHVEHVLISHFTSTTIKQKNLQERDLGFCVVEKFVDPSTKDHSVMEYMHKLFKY